MFLVVGFFGGFWVEVVGWFVCVRRGFVLKTGRKKRQQAKCKSKTHLVECVARRLVLGAQRHEELLGVPVEGASEVCIQGNTTKHSLFVTPTSSKGQATDFAHRQRSGRPSRGGGADSGGRRRRDEHVDEGGERAKGGGDRGEIGEDRVDAVPGSVHGWLVVVVLVCCAFGRDSPMRARAARPGRREREEGGAREERFCSGDREGRDGGAGAGGGGVGPRRKLLSWRMWFGSMCCACARVLIKSGDRRPRRRLAAPPPRGAFSIPPARLAHSLHLSLIHI